jgi:hypothetical protein
MRLLNWIGVVPFLCVLTLMIAGCFGGSGRHATTGAAVDHEIGASPTPPATVRVIYPLGNQASRFRSDALDRCPPGAACSIVQLLGFVKQSVGLSDGLWQRQVTETLECAPAHGTYADPEATCRALFDLTHRMAKNRITACSCPLGTAIAAIQPRVVGVINGRRTVLHLDACTVCSLGPEAARDAQVLMPVPPY